MAGKQSSLILVLVVLAGISGICSAVTHTVGGNAGWMIPTSPTVYTTWANGLTFAVGDVLVFNFATGAHTVAEVNNAGFTGCSASRPIGAIHTTGPANITLATAGIHYFICTIPTHCTNGQRLSVTVTGPSGGASPAASPASTPAATTPAEGPTTTSEGPSTTPAGTPNVPAGGSPAEVPSGSSPSGNFAASTGVTMFSLVSVAIAALMF